MTPWTPARPFASHLDRTADGGNVVVNIGPSHPATHGTIQIVAELDGETVKRADVHCGYLHRGFEKEAEHHTYHKVIPYVDRLNYCSALNNGFAYAEAVEKLLGIEITRRCIVLRTLLCEYNRIADHVTCVAASIMEMGAMTAFLYLMTVRDYIFEHLNHLTGARLTYSYVRIGGLARDLPEGWLTRLEEILVFTERYLERIHGLLDHNRIFIDRTRDVAVMTPEHALNWGFTGPTLRSTGLAIDLRKDAPYLAYPELDFEVPVGIKGDNYDRYYVRMCEIDESIAMVRQCVGLLSDGPVSVDDPRVTLPGQGARLHRDRGARASLQARQRRASSCRRARSTCRTRRPTASSASTSSATARPVPTSFTCARRASCTWAACTRCSRATRSPTWCPRSGR